MYVCVFGKGPLPFMGNTPYARTQGELYRVGLETTTSDALTTELSGDLKSGASEY